MEERKDKDKKAIITIILIVIVSIIFAAITGNYIVELSLIKRARGNDHLNIVFSSRNTSYKTEGIKGYPIEYTRGAAHINNLGDPTISGLNAYFNEPGQSVTYDLFIMNLSPYTAFLDEVVYGTLDSNGKFKSCTYKKTNQSANSTCNYIEVTVSVGSNFNNFTVTDTSYAPGHKLLKSTWEPISVTISYLKDAPKIYDVVYVEFAPIYLKYRQLENTNN